MREPIVITISHRLGRDEARQRLDVGLGRIRGQLTPFVSALDYAWSGYRLSFNATTMLHVINACIDVEDETVRVEIGLPLLLRMLSRTISSRVRSEGTRLLGKPADT